VCKVKWVNGVLVVCKRTLAHRITNYDDIILAVHQRSYLIVAALSGQIGDICLIFFLHEINDSYCYRLADNLCSFMYGP